jgi:tRNA (cytidine/uridine-2'-O-)-methyltransferase
MHLVLYEPDIPQNCGALLRLCACMGVTAHIIEPCGFLFDDRRMRRAGMDYLAQAQVIRHSSWRAYRESKPGRLVLLTTRAATTYSSFVFDAEDHIMVGRESAGVPEAVHTSADARLLIPMRPGFRSLNVAQSAAMVLGEALRQTGGFPKAETSTPETL